MKALILAGGLGTRLRPIVADRPKPMVVVSGRPFLEHQIQWLRSQGVCDLVLCLGHMADHVKGYFGDGQGWGVCITCVVEEELLGTAGAIKNAASQVDGPFFVLNGDSWLDADLGAMLASHRQRLAAGRRVLGTLAAVRAEDAFASGALTLGEGNRIVGFCEKGQAGPGWINGGIYLLEPEMLDLIPVQRPVSLECETFPLALARGYGLYAYPMKGFFVDIGTPAGYRRMQEHMKEQES